MMISTTTQTRKKNKIKLWTIAFWLLLWQFASMALDKQILLASPLSVGRCLLSLVRTFSFWESIWFSLERIALGFFCAAAGGVLLSALAYHVKLIRDILALPVAVLKATPVASFIVLVLIWMPSGNLSILISLIMAFPIIYTNLLDFLRIFVLPVQLRSACALRRGSQQRSLAFPRVPSEKNFTMQRFIWRHLTCSHGHLS